MGVWKLRVVDLGQGRAELSLAKPQVISRGIKKIVFLDLDLISYMRNDNAYQSSVILLNTKQQLGEKYDKKVKNNN